ncbi:MAG: AI-2E family transporter [Verrucomicrobia bacterium]|nr:AI-2E family transporter [Verrucomicrobiota bacterium]
MTKPAKISYTLILLMLVLVASLGMATPLITTLFSYFALEKLTFTKNKWLTTGLFTLLVIGFFYVFAFFLKEAFETLPKIVTESIPSIIEFANKKDIKLPFDDSASLKAEALKSVKNQLGYLGNFARIATKEFVFLLIGLVVAASTFINPKIDLDRERHRIRNNLYSIVCVEIAARFSGFYRSFATVMGAQIIISTINTFLTAVFIFSVSLPYAAVVIGVTFLCGLLPIIGNIISNAVIVGIAFTISPKLAIAALIFLVVLHKLEYFLNSKIIGDRIRNPVWLTLLGLILGERLMGIPGMILAPVVLNYVKMEATEIEVPAAPKPSLPIESRKGENPIDAVI